MTGVLFLRNESELGDETTTTTSAPNEAETLSLLVGQFYFENADFISFSHFVFNLLFGASSPSFLSVSIPLVAHHRLE